MVPNVLQPIEPNYGVFLVFVLCNHHRQGQQTQREQNRTKVSQLIRLHQAKAQDSNRYGIWRELIQFNVGKLFHAADLNAVSI